MSNIIGFSGITLFQKDTSHHFLNLTKDLPEIILGFLTERERSQLSLTSKGCAIAVVNYRKLYPKLLSKLLHGFGQLVIEYLKPVPGRLNYWEKHFKIAGDNASIDHKELFTLRELRSLDEIWRDYLHIRRLEYAYYSMIVKEVNRVFKDNWDSQLSAKEYESGDFFEKNLAIPYLKAVTSEEIEKMKGEPAPELLKQVESCIFSKYGPILSKALKENASPIKGERPDGWLKKLYKVTNLFCISSEGVKLSKMEKQWHRDLKASLAKID